MYKSLRIFSYARVSYLFNIRWNACSCAFTYRLWPFAKAMNQQKWWHMQDFKTLRSMRWGSGVSRYTRGSSWPHTALCRADLGKNWHVETASIPSCKKTSFPVFVWQISLHLPSLFKDVVQDNKQTFEKLASYQVILQEKTKCPEHFKKSKQTTLIYAGFKRLSKPCVYGLQYSVGSQVPVILSTNATVAMPRGFKGNNWNTKRKDKHEQVGMTTWAVGYQGYIGDILRCNIMSTKCIARGFVGHGEMLPFLSLISYCLWPIFAQS